MALWTRSKHKAKKEPGIKDGVLVKCPVKEGTFTIPDDVTAVKSDAFEGCENVKINYSPEYMINELSRLIHHEMRSIDREFKIHPVFISYEDYYPNLKVTGMDADSIEKAIRQAIEKNKYERTTPEWKVTVIDAESIPAINKEIELLGRDNLVKKNEDSVSTLHNIPFLIQWPAQQLGAISKTINELISKEGFGILFIKNLTAGVKEILHPNFVYNLIKRHSFDFVRLSPKWLLIIEVGKGVRIEASVADCGKWFTTHYYKDISPERYLKDVKTEGKLIEADKETNFEDLFDDDEGEENIANETKENETLTSSLTKKEIDWEERHFQICLALISRADIDTRAQGFPETNNIEPSKIIQQADKMVEALKKHHEEQNKI